MDSRVTVLEAKLLQLESQLESQLKIIIQLSQKLTDNQKQSNVLMEVHNRAIFDKQRAEEYQLAYNKRKQEGNDDDPFDRYDCYE